MFLSKTFFRYAFLAASALYVIAMFILAVIPYPTNIVSLSADKSMHFLEFFVLSMLLLSTLTLHRVRDRFLLALIIIVFLALASEVVQLFVLDRTFSVFDMIADLSGAAASFVLFYLGGVLWTLFKRSS